MLVHLGDCVILELPTEYFVQNPITWKVVKSTTA